MEKAKPVDSPLASHLKLSSSQCLSSLKKEDMKSVPNKSTIGSLIYVMVCTMPKIAHTISVVS